MLLVLLRIQSLLTELFKAEDKAAIVVKQATNNGSEYSKVVTERDNLQKVRCRVDCLRLS